MPLELKSQNGSTQTYKDPAQDVTYVFKGTEKPKTLVGNLRVDNLVEEIAVYGSSLVTIGTTEILEPWSVRVRTSGSTHVQDKIELAILALSAQFPTWNGENVFKTYFPKTPPVYPAA